MFCITFHHLGSVVISLLSRKNVLYHFSPFRISCLFSRHDLCTLHYGDSLIIYYIGRVQFTRASVIFKVSFFSFGLRLMYPLLIVIFCCI